MLPHTSNTIFDTLVVSRKIYGTMKTRFSIRKDIQVDGKCPIYLYIGGNEVRINLKLYVVPQFWLRDKKRVKAVNQELQDINLALDVVEARLTSIKTSYRLTETILTAQLLADEFLMKLSRVNFVAFFKEALEHDKTNLTAGSYDRHHSVYMKLKEYNSNIPFYEINLAWINKYKAYLKNVKKNQETTVASNMASIKKFLGIAEKYGVKLQIKICDIEVGSTKGNRTYLNENELKKCFSYYSSDFITERNKLILGYFLFSCMTGLRISNVQRLTRQEVEQKDIQLIMVKGNKDRIISLNAGARKLVEENENLFVKKFADQHINDELKKIMRNLGITKKISFHCARHTFATSFLKVGGKVEMLKELLGHSSINQTMIYVHIVQADANKEIFLLDNLFKTD
jgi:site-specific recombinase XerD